MGDSHIILDRHGDIEVKVGGPDDADKTTFVSCSRTLARVSPVFDHMLYGTFAEGRCNQDPQDDWTINLPDDNPVPMKVFLNIAHANFSEVPKDLTVGDLYELVVLTHYYDSTRLLTPWVETWMSSLGSKQSTPPSDMPKLLWISWEFGRREDVTTISRQMLLEFDGNWFNDTDKLEDIQTPPYIIGE